MSEMKELIDQYAEENRQLRMQVEQFLLLIRDLTFMNKDEKGQIRMPNKISVKATKYELEIKPLKTAIIFSVKERTEE